jgi:ABC-type sugar transport system ATPase subunit
MTAVLEVERPSKTFTLRRTLDSVSTAIDSGEVNALLGLTGLRG